MNQVVERLAALGVTLPKPAAPVANYVGAQKGGALLFVSGQLPGGADGKLAPDHIGKLGPASSVETGAAAARQCAINVLAQVKAATGGDLDRVRRCVKVTAFVNAVPGFTQHPEVANGASDLFVEVLGDAGRHARAAVGAGSLPRNVAVEVEAVFEIA